MKTILVPLFDGDSTEADILVKAALTTALQIAEKFNAHMEGLFVRGTPITGAAPVEISPRYLDGYREYWDESCNKARNLFSSFMADHDIPVHKIGEASDKVTASWREIEGSRPRTIGDYGRLFDLIVIPRIPEKADDEWMPVCEAALFETGRPVVVAPPVALGSFGKSIVIAWNGSTETAGTISMAMPILMAAEKVSVLSIKGATGGMVPGPSGEMVATHLLRNGIKTTEKTVMARGLSAGAAVLENATASGADLLVKGAYTHSRLRQIIFGGTTRHVFYEARIPVLIAH
ncbi:MAG: universal stress protein [Rhodospirillales bacterium]|nr:universal stress protein [Rhodospirillales bacterium]